MSITATTQEFYLEDNIGNPASGLSGTMTVQISVDGSTWATALGAVTDLADGRYTYALTVADKTAGAFALLRITDPSLLDATVIYIPADYTIIVSESVAANRRIPIYLTDEFGDPYTVAPIGADITLSVNGASFVASTGSIGTIGQGAFYYQATALEVGTLGSLTVSVDNGVTPEYLWAQTIGNPPGDLSDPPVIDIISEPEDRLDPYVVEIYDDVGIQTLNISYLDHDGIFKLTVYDLEDEDFSHPFGGRSTRTGSGTEVDPYVFTIYRRGGWPTEVNSTLQITVVDVGGNKTEA